MKKIFNFIENSEQLIIDLQSGLTAIPAINPENNGDGEYKKFLFLKDFLLKNNINNLEDILVPDDRVSSKTRPSLIATIQGEDDSKRLWFITHTDVVPPGEMNLWETDPFKAHIKDGKIYGRGTEDNQQSLTSTFIAAKAFIENNIKPKYTTKLLFVADEEVGSKYGIEWILENKNFFNKNDLILTPDFGDEQGSSIEIAEKSILWLTFKISGKQSHGSRPDRGINTTRASSHLGVRMEKLTAIFNNKDDMYDLPFSTFEPTKRGNNITNMNTIPGEDHLGYDCRILPAYNLDDIINEIQKIVKSVEDDFGVKISTEILQKVQAPAGTPADSEIVLLLKKSIKKITGKEPSTIGIGGGTVAASFRKKGYNAALWSTIDMTLHGPNEYAKIKNIITDAKVFADIMLG